MLYPAKQLLRGKWSVFTYNYKLKASKIENVSSTNPLQVANYSLLIGKSPLATILSNSYHVCNK